MKLSAKRKWINSKSSTPYSRTWCILWRSEEQIAQLCRTCFLASSQLLSWHYLCLCKFHSRIIAWLFRKCYHNRTKARSRKRELRIYDLANKWPALILVKHLRQASHSQCGARTDQLLMQITLKFFNHSTGKDHPWPITREMRRAASTSCCITNWIPNLPLQLKQLLVLNGNK